MEQDKNPTVELLYKLHNNRHKLEEWFQSEVGMLVVEYLNNQKEEAYNSLMYSKEIKLEVIATNRETIRVIEDFIGLPEMLGKFRIPTEEEKQKIAKSRDINQKYGVPQAVAMGQTRYTEIEAED
jgi:hypothetical protein